MDTQIPLASYAEEIRSLIHTGRNAEALTLCKHILRYYPKHVETYRLTAEASEENGDHAGAQELFRRVLSADPEQVVAHAGLAIIFEQAKMIEDAIWHLERANEFAPANLEIRKELLRLYGETEDQPRARLKLSPGGLARLYVQEGLYAQAIQEFRAIVAAGPNRLDARVALAETLWRAGKIREAADVALQLLDPLPYCLKANLILGAAYHETGLPEAETYLQRARELDPSNQIALTLLGSRSPLPLAQPMVPRYVPGAPVESVEEIAAPAKEETPLFVPTEPAEQLKAFVELATPEVSALPSIVTAETLPKSTVAESGLPAWLREDFREMAEASQPPPAPKPMVKPTIGLRSSLPPWLMELQETLAEPPKPAMWIAPGEIEKEEPSEVVESAPPAWLFRQPQVEEKESVQVTEAPPPAWLTPTQPEAELSAVAEEATPALAEPERPAWLEETPAAATTIAEQAAPSQPQAEVVSEAELPDWLRAGAESARIEQPAEPRAEETPIEVAPVALPREELAPRVVEEAIAPLEVKPKRKRQPRGYTHLILAREHRDANRLEDALAEYDYVVQHGPRLIDEAIGDLKELIEMWGSPLDAHRILGDAYVRADRLAEALECYHFVLDRITQAS